MDINNNIEKFSKGIVSYLEFSKNFKNVSQNQIVIKNENNNSFIYRKFNFDCYIIEKKVLDDFFLSINFNQLTTILDPINDENKKKFDEKLKIFFEKNPNFSYNNYIKIYSEFKEIKEIIQHFEKYSFVNEEFLCNVLNINNSILKDKVIKISKNENNTYLVSTTNNYIIEYNNCLFGEIEEYKNLYYVEELTKKIFILLYVNELKLKDKAKQEIKDFYNFKNYYLINKKWFEEYKDFFLYALIIKKLENIINNDDERNNQNINMDKKDKIYSYKKVKYNLDDISYNIGQIKLYNKTKISNTLRNAKNLIPEKKKILIKKKAEKNEEYQLTEEPELVKNELNIPTEFYIINEDIFELLKKEQFFYNLNNDIMDEIKYKILIGNNNLIIKNQQNDSDDNYSNEYLIYTDKNKINIDEKDSNEIHDSFILYYILKYNKNKTKEFFNDLKILNGKNGLREYIKIREISQKEDNKNFEEDIKDIKENFLGNFINIKINKNFIINKNEINENEERIQVEDRNKKEKIKESEFEVKKQNQRKKNMEENKKIEFKNTQEIKNNKINEGEEKENNRDFNNNNFNS